MKYLWTKIREILGRCRAPLVLSNSLVQLSTSHCVQKVKAISLGPSLEVVEKPINVKGFWPPIFMEG